MTHDTIAAMATPAGSGGIGIIRVSGAEAPDLVSGLFSTTKKGPRNCLNLESHRVIHGYFFDGATGHVIDEVLLIPMLAPRSYTAENVVEIQAHSGPLVLGTILDQLIKKGARLADPGEFTKRAFLNGRIDLTQAEAVMDIINAKTSGSLKIAASQVLGNLKDPVKKARETLISLLARLEAAIDFPEEADDLIPQSEGEAIISPVLTLCLKSIRLFDETHFLRDGIKLAICGAPNVGKSSLMNRLLTRERSIVTALPGTTRDLIEESITINGIPFLISDTAGMHQTDDLVEKIGIERAKKHVQESDLILFMKEAGTAFSKTEFNAIIPAGKKVILVINKIDLTAKKNPLFNLPDSLKELPVIRISALKNQGIDALRKMITDLFCRSIQHSSSIVPNLRHKLALERAAGHLKSAQSGFSSNQNEETLAIDIRNAADLLGEITGDTAGIDILDTIFSNFCIGK